MAHRKRQSHCLAKMWRRFRIIGLSGPASAHQRQYQHPLRYYRRENQRRCEQGHHQPL
jgi:hypothetical protein